MPNSWTPDQIRQFQDYWDTEFAGDLARSRRAKFVPGDTAARVHQTKEPEQKNDFDEWLARIICYAFSVPPQWAVKLMNRATADNQSAHAEDEGLAPTKEWVKDLVDEIIADEFASPDLELAWLEEDTDAAQTDAQLESRLKLGAVTLNELRDSLGLDPYANPAADRPMVLTGTGYVPIEAGASSAPSPAGVTRGSMLADGIDQVFQKYSPDQPRLPAGNSDGGQWTSGGTDGSPTTLTDGSEANGTSRPVQYAALDSGTRTDATPVAVGVQYAGGPEDDESESRANGRPFEGSLSQEVRANNALLQYRFVLDQIRRFDPNWKPSASLTSPDSIEGDIARLRAATEKAKEHLAGLKALGFRRNADTGEVITSADAKTGNLRVDSTTEILMDVFRKVMGEIGLRPDLTPREYGTLVHTKCAEAIRALNLPGVDTNDVERTFGVDNDDTYGRKDSIRPDVILRDDDGSIIAIYDFKTGNGLRESRVIRLRHMTKSGNEVFVIELSRSRGPLLKRR